MPPESTEELTSAETHRTLTGWLPEDEGIQLLLGRVPPPPTTWQRSAGSSPIGGPQSRIESHTGRPIPWSSRRAGLAWTPCPLDPRSEPPSRAWTGA